MFGHRDRGTKGSEVGKTSVYNPLVSIALSQCGSEVSHF